MSMSRPCCASARQIRLEKPVAKNRNGEIIKKQQKPLLLNESRGCSLKRVLKARQRVSDRAWLALGSSHLSFGQLGLDVQIPTVAGSKHETFDNPVFVAIIERISFGVRQRDMGRL